MDKKIKAGIFGIGHLGKLHLKLLKEISSERNDVEVIGIYDTDTEKMKQLSTDNGLKAFSSPEDLIAEINAAIIVTPTSYHFELAEKTISAGINTFIEKPVTDTIVQADKLLELEKKNKVKVQIGHIERFNPAILSLENFNINPLFIESHRLSQFNPRGTDVSVIQDLMIHDIDIILNLVKSPVTKISANGVAIITDKIDIANARLEFENGCVANITASRISLNKMRKMRLFQKNAYLSVDFSTNSSEVFRLSGDDEEVIGFNFGTIEHKGKSHKIIYVKPSVEEINPLKYELEKFIESIVNNTEPFVTLEDGRIALDVASRIIKEIESNSK
ncbi:Gfo/Idh/MocA family oxidoreductase [soil metagenome]